MYRYSYLIKPSNIGHVVQHVQYFMVNHIEACLKSPTSEKYDWYIHHTISFVINDLDLNEHREDLLNNQTPPPIVGLITTQNEPD